MFSKITKITALALAFALSAVVGNAVAGSMTPGEGVTVHPIEGTNLEEKFQHKVLYRALEELGYSVGDPSEVEYQTMHLAIGQGDGDFTAVHWDPLHAAFFNEAGGDAKMSKVGSYIAGALQGYLVDMASFNCVSLISVVEPSARAS